MFAFVVCFSAGSIISSRVGLVYTDCSREGVLRDFDTHSTAPWLRYSQSKSRVLNSNSVKDVIPGYNILRTDILGSYS